MEKLEMIPRVGPELPLGPADNRPQQLVLS